MFDTERIIYEIKSHPVLWDSNHPDFNRRPPKQAAWEDVAAKVYEGSEDWSNYDKFGKVREVQKRWRNLRDNYIKELRYQKKVDRGLAIAKRRKYIYFGILNFLTPGKSPRKKSSDEESSSDQDDDQEMDQDMSTQDAKMTSTAPDDHQVTDSDQAQHEVSTSSASRLNQFTSNTHHSEQDYLPIHYLHSEQNVSARPSQNDHIPNYPMVSLPYEHSDQDDDKLFLLSLLPYFKKLEDAQKLQARINVIKLLYDMIYKPS